MQICPRIAPSAIALVAAVGAASAHADINGFGDFSQFSINRSDGASDPVIDPVTGSILLTGSTTNQSRSVFGLARESVEQFSASFTFRAAGNPDSATAGGFGATFVVQNSAFGVQTVAPWNTQPVFGYGGTFVPFNDSVAVSLEFGPAGDGDSFTGVYTDGLIGGGSLPMGSVDLYSGNPIDVQIAYNGSLLSTTFTDSVTGGSFTRFASLDIPSIVNGAQAYVGFTAATGLNTSASMEFSNFRFTSVPAPSSLGLLGLGALCGVRRRRGIAAS